MNSLISFLISMAAERGFNKKWLDDIIHSGAYQGFHILTSPNSKKNIQSKIPKRLQTLFIDYESIVSSNNVS